MQKSLLKWLLQQVSQQVLLYLAAVVVADEVGHVTCLAGKTCQLSQMSLLHYLLLLLFCLILAPPKRPLCEKPTSPIMEWHNTTG